MYESFFNLRVKPFELVPDPAFIFLSRSHKKAITYLDYGIRERAGFILLTGDVGSGKTTLIRNLLAHHGEKIVLALVINTSVTSDQLLAMINDDFGLATTGKDKISLLRDLNEFLVQQYVEGRQPVLIIDEAQNLAPELLEEVRMLSNLETTSSKLLQIVLSGQPELRTILSLPELLQLRQRISINCNLSPLTRVETEQYIRHRLEVAGNAEAVQFETESLDLIYRYSRGIPRLINIICDFLLLSAFAEETRTITRGMTMEVIGDMDFENHFWGSARPQPVVPAGAVPSAPPPAQPSLPPHPQPPEMQGMQGMQGMQELLTAILQRIDSIEFDVKHPPAESTAEHDKHLAMLQDAIESNRAYTDAHLQEMRNKLEDILSRIKPENAIVEQYEVPKKGIIRRLLGSGQAL